MSAKHWHSCKSATVCLNGDTVARFKGVKVKNRTNNPSCCRLSCANKHVGSYPKRRTKSFRKLLRGRIIGGVATRLRATTLKVVLKVQLLLHLRLVGSPRVPRCFFIASHLRTATSFTRMSKKSPIWERLSAPKDKGEEWREEKRKQYAAEGMKRFSSPGNGYFGNPTCLVGACCIMNSGVGL